MTGKDWPRFLLTAVIMLMFGGALLMQYSVGLEETLKAAVMLAIGYWLGSSKGSADKSNTIDGLTKDGISIKQPANDPIPVREQDG